MLSRSGSRLTRRQHSGPPSPDSGHTCRAFTVSYKKEKQYHILSQNKYGERSHITCVISVTDALCLPHHVGVRSAGHALASVEVEEFVDL